MKGKWSGKLKKNIFWIIREGMLYIVEKLATLLLKCSPTCLTVEKLTIKWVDFLYSVIGSLKFLDKCDSNFIMVGVWSDGNFKLLQTKAATW